jgi:hypothetical protein
MMQLVTTQLCNGIEMVEAIINKAAGVSEVAQIARIEVLDRQFMMARWNAKARKMVKAVTPMLLGSGTLQQVMAKVDSIFAEWEPEIRTKHYNSIERAYKLARIAAWKKTTSQIKGSLQYNIPNTDQSSVAKAAKSKATYAALKPSFDLADIAAVDALKHKEAFWMGKHHKHIQGPIREAARQVIETGRSATQGAVGLSLSKAASKVEIPSLFYGTQRQYLEGVVANAVATARVQGQLRSFIDLGVTRYVIVNPVDERTCPVCAHMEGKTFTITNGISVMEAETAATTPAGVKSAHPWYNEKELKGISPNPGSVGQKDADVLAAKGYSLPPFHFRCRCTIDMSVEAGSFVPIEDTPKVIHIGGIPIKPGHAAGHAPVVPKLKPITGKTAKQLEQSGTTAKEAIYNVKTADTLKLAEELEGNVAFEKYVAEAGKISHHDFMKLPKSQRIKRMKRRIDYAIQAWSLSSARGTLSVAMQIAARDEFGLKKAVIGHMEKKTVAAAVGNKVMSKGLRALLRTMYDDTQMYFKKKDIKKLIAYRGMKFKDAALMPKASTTQGKLFIDGIKSQPLSSHTVAPRIVGNFIGPTNSLVAAAEVPVERILSFHKTGLGTKREYEIVLLGGEDKMSVYAWRSSTQAEFAAAENLYNIITGGVK